MIGVPPSTPREAMLEERAVNMREAMGRIEHKLDKMDMAVEALQIAAAEWKGTVRGVLVAAPALGGLLGALAALLMKRLGLP